MRRTMILAAMGLVASVANADGPGTAAGSGKSTDKVLIAAPGAWVKPVAFPADAKADSKDDVAVRVLLRDEQYDLQPGKMTRYFENAFRIQSSQGLSAGSINVTWNPDFETPVVHKLLIRRGDKLIDVLASGQSFTVVRRETNLENAVLDGELTATIQPEGLQVGDIIDFSGSITSSDPAIGRHIEQAAAAWNGLPVDHAHLRALWPATLPVQLRAMGGLPVPKPVKKDGLASIELSLDDVKPIPAPKGAPARYQYGRLIELTDFTSWGGVADLMGPLFTKAATLPASGALQAEIAKIKALSPDPKTRAEAVLALVQDRVRYVLLAINDGGLIPADAETTWSRRFGDCKGKTVLLLALLHALDIQADPVVVNSQIGDGMDQRLPLVGMFDHVLVRAQIAGRTYWLDGTRSGDRHLDAIRVPPFHWALPLVPGSTKLVALVQPPFAEPQIVASMRIDASAGIAIPAPAHGERLISGDEAIGANISLAAMAPDARDQALRAFWKARYDFIDIKAVTSSYDPDRQQLKLVLDGTAKMEWDDGWYEADRVWVGYRADFTRDAGSDQSAPFLVDYPSYSRASETIILPPGEGAFSVYHGEDVDRTVAGVAYKRRTELKANVFTVVAEDRAVAPEFPASEAVADQAALRDLYRQSVHLGKTNRYTPTKAEFDGVMAATPTTAAAFVERAQLLAGRGRVDDAIADLNKAIALDPKAEGVLSARGGIYAMKGDFPAALRDLSAAVMIEPRNATAFRALGFVDMRRGDYSGAIAAFTSAIEIEPRNAFALSQRAVAYRETGHREQAAADAAQAIKANPHDVESYLLLANIERSMGDKAGALRQADAMTLANPDNAYAFVVAGRVRGVFGLKEQALRDFDHAIAIKPEAYIYINRSEVRSSTDTAGKLADLDAALKLEPNSPEALIDKADLQRLGGDLKGALATLTTAHMVKGDDPMLLVHRGIVQLQLGHAPLADKDFADARALAKTANGLNGLCWEKTVAGVALESALAECDAALALEPNASSILDSRGLTLLRLGRLDEAIVSYNRALAKSPALAPSLYGRAVAEARKGDKAKAALDAAAALNADPDVRDDFRKYGVAMPGTESASAS